MKTPLTNGLIYCASVLLLVTVGLIAMTWWDSWHRPAPVAAVRSYLFHCPYGDQRCLEILSKALAVMKEEEGEKVKNFLALGLFTLAFLLTAHVRFAHADMTETQLFLAFWQTYAIALGAVVLGSWLVLKEET